MSEPERICANCAQSRTKDGTVYVNEDMAYCERARVEGGPLVNCPSQRFAVSDEAGNVCGADAIFWETRS